MTSDPFHGLFDYCWRQSCECKALDRDLDEARAQLAEARAVMRLLRQHRTARSVGIPYGLLEREAGLIGDLDDEGDGKDSTP